MIVSLGCSAVQEEDKKKVQTAINLHVSEWKIYNCKRANRKNNSSLNKCAKQETEIEQLINCR